MLPQTSRAAEPADVPQVPAHDACGSDGAIERQAHVDLSGNAESARKRAARETGPERGAKERAERRRYRRDPRYVERERARSRARARPRGRELNRACVRRYQARHPERVRAQRERSRRYQRLHPLTRSRASPLCPSHGPLRLRADVNRLHVTRLTSPNATRELRLTSGYRPACQLFWNASSLLNLLLPASHCEGGGGPKSRRSGYDDDRRDAGA